MTYSIRMLGIADGRDVLAGAPRGKEALAKIITAVRSPSEPTAVLMDFSGIKVATASFLRESVIGFRNYCTNTERNLYPVLANANELILEELEFLLKLHGDALISCETASNSKVQSTRILGHLNEKEKLTFDAICAVGEVDAALLASKFDKTDAIKITGWNNRLAALVNKGVVMEIRKGRSKLYRPLLA
jgi:hypothetical protein